jgi:Zn-dependent protease with chaperone function
MDRLPDRLQAEGIAAASGSAAHAGWDTWSAAERESFFDAIARHRRGAWRVTFVSLTVNSAVALVVAILMAPLFYGAFALLLDVLNLAVPTPNLVPAIGHALDRALNAPARMSLADWLRLGAVAALPGLLWMACMLRSIRKVLTLCMSCDEGDPATRALDTAVLAEQRFGNVVAEMAIAANLPPPRVVIVDTPAVDAVALGLDERHSTVIITQGLTSLLNRAQMEGVAASLVASIANGDTRIGLRAALSLGLFGLIARLGSIVSQEHARRDLVRIVTAIALPTPARARIFLTELSDPFEDTEGKRAAKTATRAGLAGRWDKLRPYLWLPLAGPLVMTGFLGALFNLFVLGPLLSLAWRQRKYMSDAIAVRLTRDPDTLASALQQMAGKREPPVVSWAAHMSIVDHEGRQRGPFSGSAVPMFPSIERRLRALAAMGAHIARPVTRHMPLWVWLVMGSLLSLLAILVAMLFPLLIWLSLALTMLFTGLPFAILHALLRWLGHH